MYYPPEHQMFAQKEEAAWRAQVNNLKFIEVPTLTDYFICREPWQKKVVNTNTKQKARAKVKAVLALQSFQFVCHYAAACRALSYKKIYFVL